MKDKMYDMPVFIIAAARSGTKMLREVLSASSDIIDFPYDMNYIWKYGNYEIEHDELTRADIKGKTVQFIRKIFEKKLRWSNARRVLEKSVPNSLRVEFVRTVFPEGKIIHLYRDGRDVAASARLCWQAGVADDMIQSNRDRFKKIVNFPLIEAWPYLSRYLKIYASRRFQHQDHVQSWGPRFKDIDAMLERYSLIEVCGMQWARCVNATLRDLSIIVENRDYINVRYEDLVAEPVKEMHKIINFLALDDVDRIIDKAKKSISAKYVNSWRTTLNEDEMKLLLPHIESVLKKMRYHE